MKRSLGLSWAIGLFVVNYGVAIADRIPDGDFMEEAAVTAYEEQLPASLVGSNSISAGLIGQPPFGLFDPSRADELTPSFVSSLRMIRSQPDFWVSSNTLPLLYSAPMTAERALWTGVLMQAIYDSRRLACGRLSSGTPVYSIECEKPDALRALFPRVFPLALQVSWP
ncbi:MAG: hypothetical protein ACREQW_12785 [Candidatus Binatia bacterium]